MSQGLRSFWALAIALCISVLVIVIVFVYFLQQDMARTRTEFAHVASVATAVGESTLDRLFNVIIEQAKERSESGGITTSLSDVFNAADLLPLIALVCERNGTEVNVLHDTRNQKTTVDCLTDNLLPLEIDDAHQVTSKYIDVLVPRTAGDSFTIGSITSSEKPDMSLVIRVTQDEQRSILFHLDPSALLNIFRPDLTASDNIKGESCLTLKIQNKFVQIACHNTSETTYPNAVEISAATNLNLYDSVDFTVHNTHWQMLFRPNAENIAGHLSSTPFVVLGGTVIFSGLICLFVFSSAHKAVKLSQQNNQLAELLGRLEQQNIDLDQFATMAAHDLQAPLRFMVNQAHVLRLDIGDLDRPDLHELSDIIIQQGARMQALVLDLLSYCRAGQNELTLQFVNIPQLIEDQISGLIPQADYQEPQITVGKLPATLLTDQHKLAEIIRNLLDNAVKFSQQNGPACVSIKASQEDGCGQWTFVIDDNGCGIDAVHRKNIFRPFRRLDVTLDGTGIGLAIVKKLVERLQGRIWVDTASSGGARFCFTLPELYAES